MTVFLPAKRGFHSTGVKRMGGHGHDEPYYLHAKHMYNLDRMKYQKLTMSLAVFTAFSIGAGVPVFAVVFQQKKTASSWESCFLTAIKDALSPVVQPGFILFENCHIASCKVCISCLNDKTVLKVKYMGQAYIYKLVPRPLKYDWSLGVDAMHHQILILITIFYSCSGSLSF